MCIARYLGAFKDRIPAIDRPRFDSVRAAQLWLRPREPVIAVRPGNDARAYPLQVLMFHEIVNDQIGGLPVAVTFCPLCNAPAAAALSRRIEGQVLQFALRNGRFVDLATGSEWSLFGEAVADRLEGERLISLDSGVHFAFAWLAFNPDTEIWRAPERRTSAVHGLARRFVPVPSASRARIASPHSVSNSASPNNMNEQHATVRPRRTFRPSAMAPLISYLTELTPSRQVLWCYLIWYLVMAALYFDASPRLWLTSAGLGLIIGFALTLGVSAGKGSKPPAPASGRRPSATYDNRIPPPASASRF